MYSGNDHEFMDCGDGPRSVCFCPEFSVLKQIDEILALANKAHDLLEDLSVECQAKISQQQWNLLNSKSDDEKSRDETVLAKTYFSEPILDTAFYHLLQHDKLFMKHLNNFNALLNGNEPLIPNSDVQGKNVDISNAYNIIKKLIENHPSTSDNATCDLLQTFDELIRAKTNINQSSSTFDSTLNEESSNGPVTNSCICRICSNVTQENLSAKSKKGKAVPKRKKGPKKLSKPTRILTRNRLLKTSTFDAQKQVETTA